MSEAPSGEDHHGVPPTPGYEESFIPEKVPSSRQGHEVPDQDGETSEPGMSSESPDSVDEHVTRKEADYQAHEAGTRPMTYFLYATLTWDTLELFLRRKKATRVCLDKAFRDLENYYLSLGQKPDFRQQTEIF